MNVNLRTSLRNARATVLGRTVRTKVLRASGLLGVILIAGCGGGAPQLGNSAKYLNSIATSFPSMKVGALADVGGMLICLTGPGKATITSVRLEHTVGSIHVRAFDVRLNPYLHGGGPWMGGATGPLVQQGFPRDHVVNVACGQRSKEEVAYELGVEMARSGPGDAASGGFVVDYRVDGNRGSFTIPVATALCEGNASAPACQHVLNATGY